MKDKKDPGTIDWCDEDMETDIKISLKNEDGTLNVLKDPDKLLLAMQNHISEVLGTHGDPVSTLEELNAVTGYWLLDHQQTTFDEETEAAIKRTLN